MFVSISLFTEPSLPEHSGGGVSFFELVFTSGATLNAIFVLVTGYFSVYQNKSTWPKIVALLGQLYSSMVFVALILVIWRQPLTNEVLVKLAFPFDDSVWFVETFLWLLMVMPFLNQTLHQLMGVRKWLLILLVFLVGSLVPTYFTVYPFHQLLWFIGLYLLGGAYRQMGAVAWQKVLMSVSFLGIGWFSLWLVNAQQELRGVAFMDTSYFSSVCFAVAVVVLVDLLPDFSWQWVNRLSSLTLGIYIFHDNNFIRPLLHQLINFGQLALDVEFGVMIGFVLTRGLLVFVVAALLELVRKGLCDKAIQVLSRSWFKDLV